MSNHAKVEIYYWTTCPHCIQARALLDAKGIDYQGYDITGDDEARAKMIERTGGSKTVPQIFINDNHIGGNDDIQALEAQGELDSLLEG